MTQSTQLCSAYVLHYRAYRDTSLLVELFTEEHGRLTAVARGARSPRSNWRGLLQLFTPIYVTFAGKGELVNLRLVEPRGRLHQLMGQSLLSGFYLNELLIRTLPKHDMYSIVFQEYQLVLTKLEIETDPQLCLRYFEKQLLLQLGYGLMLEREAATGKHISAEQWYHFDPLRGCIQLSDDLQNTQLPNVFKGDSLLAIHHHELKQPEHVKDAKRLMRLALLPILGEHTLKSRELFI